MTNILIALIVFAAPCFAVGSKIESLSGSVELRGNPDAVWSAAVRGAEISEGTAVRTGPDGRALVLLSNNSRIWLKESSHIEIEQGESLVNRIALLFGSIKARIPHLKRREHFEIRTLTAVCAVRGTEVIVETNEDGALKIDVLYGEVTMDYTVPPARGSARLSLAQGYAFSTKEKGEAGAITLISREKEVKDLENWAPGIAEEKRSEGLKEKEKDRQEIRIFAENSGATEKMVRDLAVQVKESDFEAGRTLTDIHGNLVRVDQRMFRPDSRSVQFVNLVKRPAYKYVPHKFRYNGPVGGSRLDSLQAKIDFNTALPENLAEWPGFFAGNTGALHPTQATLVMANQTDRNNIFTIAYKSVYNAATDTLDDGSNLYVGTLSNFSDLGRAIGGDMTGAGLTQAHDPAHGQYSYSENGDVSGLLYSYSAGRYEINSTPIWLAAEQYVIGNGGGIKSVNDFANTGLDPLSILKNSAGQIIMYVKNDSGSGSGMAMVGTSDYNAGGENPGGRNIDLVIIPDLGMAALQRMLSAVDDLSK